LAALSGNGWKVSGTVRHARMKRPAMSGKAHTSSGAWQTPSGSVRQRPAIARLQPTACFIWIIFDV
jgi:hypothetical protein